MEAVFPFLCFCHKHWLHAHWVRALAMVAQMHIAPFLFVLVSFTSSGVFLCSSEKDLSSSKQGLLCNLICGSLEGTGSSFTTLTRNKHAHLLAS